MTLREVIVPNYLTEPHMEKLLDFISEVPANALDKRL